MRAPSRPSRLSPRSLSGALFWLVLVVVFAGLVLPLIHANRFRARIQAALESSLGRRVEIGQVALTLLPAPGFQLENVIIGDDPAFGAEHFAYMGSMQARLRLRALWTGHVQLASLTLVEPSLNLVKNAQGRWNFEALLGRAASPGGARAQNSGAARPYFPYIGIQDGRINFKFGDYKSVFYFDDVEAALSPARDAEGGWRIRFAGRPARADRLLSGMGLVKGEGDLAMARRTVRLEVALENSPVEHLLTLIYGRDFGLHGELSARAQLAGEVSDIDVQGILRAADFHRWDLLPSPETRFSVPFHGRWNLPAQKLELESAVAGPMHVRFGVEEYLTAPRWNATVAFAGAPAGPFLRASRQLGAALPPGLELHGALQGTLAFQDSFWPHGEVALEHGQLLAPDVPPVTIGEARAELDGPSFSLSPVIARVGKESVEVSAEGQLQELRAEASIAARGVRLAALRPLVQALNPQWLASVVDGYWEGRILCRKHVGEPAVWSGSGALSDVRWRLQGVESPIQLRHARVRWEPGELQLDGLSGALGQTRFTGSCRQSAGNNAVVPEIACRLRVPDLDVGQLGAWLSAEPVRSRWEVWKRALLGASPSAPSWLKTARIGGTLAVASLRVGKWEFHNVRSEVAWRNETLTLRGLQGELGKAAVSGALHAEFTGANPHFSLQAAARGVDFKNLATSFSLPANFQRGTFDVQLALSSSGRTAQDLRAALKGAGKFEGRSILLDNVEWENAEQDSGEGIEIRSLEGLFELARGRLDLTAVRMAVGKDIYQGRGSVGGRPSVLLDLACKGKQSRLVASVRPEGTVGAP